MKELRLVALVLLLLSGILCLAAQSDPDQSGYVYTYRFPHDIHRSSRSIFLCSDNSVVVFSNWDFFDYINCSGSAITKLDPGGNLLWDNSLVPYGSYSTVTGVDVDRDDNVTFLYEDEGTIQLCKVTSTGSVSIIGPSISLPLLATFSKALRTSEGDIVAIGRIADPYYNPAPLKAACFYRFSAQGDTLATAYWPSSDPSFLATAYDLAWTDNGNLLIACSFGPELNSILEVNLDGEIINRYDIPVDIDWGFGLTICREVDSQSHIVAYSTADSVSIDRFNGSSMEHLFNISRDRTNFISSMIVKPDYIILSGREGIVLKLDWDGNVLWWWLHYGYNSTDYLMFGTQSKSVLAVDDSDCVYWTWASYSSQVIVKLLPNGQVANHDEVQAPAANPLTAYPNPMKNRLSIKTDPTLRGDSIGVYNIRGELVRRLKLTDGETIWDGKDSSGRNCPNGIYLLRNNSNRSQVKKISKIN